MNTNRLITRNLLRLTAISMGVLFSAISIAVAADRLVWDKTFLRTTR